MNESQKTLETIKAASKAGTGRVYLVDLFEASTLNQVVLEVILWDLNKKGSISLYKLDNPQEITARIKDATIFTEAGSPRHICYV